MFAWNVHRLIVPRTDDHTGAKAADAGHVKSAYPAGVMCLAGEGGLPVDADRAQTFVAGADELEFDVVDALGATGLSRA